MHPSHFIKSFFSLWHLIIITIKTKQNTINTTNIYEYSINTKINMSDKFDYLNDLRAKYSHQPTFLQAVEEMAVSVHPLFEDEKNGSFYKRAFLAMTEPERTMSFRVSWEDDQGNMHYNRGWRVGFSSVLGPYKGT